MIMSIMIFYGFAIANGTLEQIAKKSVYAAKGYPFAMPIVLYLLCVVISGIGPGPYAVFAFMAPLVMAIAKETGMDRVLASVIIVGGGIGGAQTSFGVGGVIVKGLIERAGYVADAELFTWTTFVNSLIAETIIFLIAYVVLKGYKIKLLNIEKPQPFNREQRINLVLIVASLFIIMVPSLLGLIFPKEPLVLLLKKQVDVGFVAIIAAIFAFLFKLGKEKEVLAKVPWSTIILLCGMGILIDVAVRAGTIKLLAQWIATHVSSGTAPVLMTVVAGTMSFFASSLGVVAPTLFPIVQGVANQLNVNPVLLFSLILIGAGFTAFSPFSTGGALTLAGVTDEEARKTLFYKLLVLPVFALTLAILLALAGVIRGDWLIN